MTDPPSPGLSPGAETAIRPAGHEARGQPKPISRIPDKRPGAAKERRPMPYDPDLDPVFDELRSAQADHGARLAVLGTAQTDQGSRLAALDVAQADHGTRLAALEKRPQVDLTPLSDQLAGVLARLARLEAPLPPATAPAPDPIWSVLKRSQITIPAEVRVPAGQRDIYIPVTVDHTDRESFYCYVSGFANVSNGGVNVGNMASQRANFLGWEDVLYRWSPGDDLTHYVKVTTKATYTAGKTFSVVIRVKNLGDSQKGQNVKVVFADDAQHPAMPPQFHRPLRRLDLSGARRKNRFDPAALKHHDSGFLDGKPVWRSRLSHGYTQDGNQETGLYMNEDKFPGKAQSPISYDAAEGALRLHTLAFPMDARAEHDSRLFRHQAAVIQGQTMDEVCGAEGVWRMEAKIPIRRYSWPAFWLVGRGASGAKGSWTQWPPEIDILEKFNYAWGAADTAYTTTFAQHYGKVGSNSRVGAFGGEIEANQWLPGTGPLNEGYHSWACAIVYHADPRRAEVTFFFDDVEVGCHVLHARHEDMKTRLELFPIANVAVKASSSYTPEQYNTDDGRGHSGDMLIRDIAYYPAGFAMPPLAK